MSLERRGLKSVMILILIVVNAFLLSCLLWQSRTDWLSRRAARRRLAALFALDGVTLSSDVFRHDAPPESLRLSADEALQKSVAAFFLGETYLVEEEPDLRRYRSGAAAAEFFSNGDFTVTGLAVSAETLCADFCRAWPYERITPSGAARRVILAAARYDGVPVFNCRVSFSFSGDGVLREAAGTLLSRNAVPVQRDIEPLDALGALAVFQNAHRKNHLAASAISGLAPCYALERRGSGESELVPAWRVETDTLDYYVNALTGAVTAA